MGLSDRKAREHVTKLRAAARIHSGVAFEPYVKFLASKAESEIQEQVGSRLKTFRRRVSVPSHDGALAHAADNFGMLYAGASLGIEAKVLPWDLNETLEVIAGGFESFRKVIGRPVDAKRAAMTILNTHLQQNPPRFVNNISALEKKPKRAIRTKEKKTSVIIVPSKAFDAIFQDTGQARAALLALEESGLLITKQNAVADGASKGWAQTFPKINRGTENFRAIKFYDPLAGRLKAGG